MDQIHVHGRGSDMTTGITLIGDKELADALRRWGKFAQNEINEAIDATAMNVHSDAVKSIQRGTKSGRTYRKYEPNREHQASAPGEAPSSDTGELAGSIQIIDRLDVAYVGSDLDYAEFLEFGTSDMQERPWLRPAVEKNRLIFRKRLINAIKAARKRITG